MEMGDKIKALRLANHMTLEELGNKVGVGKSTVRKWEQGIIANMKRDKIAKLAKALDTTPAYLMGWEENLTTDNADLTVELMTRKDCIEVVKILLRNDENYNKQVLQYCIFLETQK